MTLLLVAATLAAAVPAGLRWLRVAQREHYIPGSTLRFAWRWWSVSAENRTLFGLAVVAAPASLVWPVVALLTVAAVAAGPVGLAVRGRTSPLAWTARLRRVAAVAALVVAAAAAVSLLVSHPLPVVLGGLALPAAVDLALVLLGPLERRLSQPWVDRARRRLAEVGPRVVAITGSYGKTSTKGLVAHLLAGTARVVATPASFNNRLGLARSINEHLSSGTEVFVAELGTYGPGEIAEMCSWVTPEVGVITAIGPVHLERMKSEERIAAAKREILQQARVAVLNVDHPLLRRIADAEEAHRRVVRCSVTDPAADVLVDKAGVVLVQGVEVARLDPDATVHPSNLACALGAVLALGFEPSAVAPRLRDLPVPPHRQAVGRSERGFAIIDDTYNSNPAGAEAALELLASLAAPEGKRVVVTPGMVELGERQAEENQAFAAAAARVATHLLVVGRTNRRALLAGARVGGAVVIVVPSREAAVAWARESLGPGDAVLYENDLPDHYP